MPEQEKHWIPEASQVKEYQDILFRALQAVHSYDGTERSYDRVTRELIGFEEKIKSMNLVPEGSIHDQEARAVELFLRRDHGKEPLNISTLLDLASESVRRAIRSSFAPQGPEAQTQQPLFIRHIPGVILPPALEPRPQQGEGVFEPARVEERLFELTQLLERNNIFIDDLIVSVGALSQAQMRKISYAVVEIPRINRTVLVCDQVGEATFVIHGLGDPRRFLTVTKEELLKNSNFTVRRIIRRDPSSWEGELGALLFTEEAWHAQQLEQGAQGTPVRSSDRRSRVDVRKFIDVRDAILAGEYNTPESWVDMTNKKALTFKLQSLGNIGLKAIATILGVEGNPINNRLPRLECARQIFGDEPVILEAIRREKITPVQIKEAILASEYNTPESWVMMTNKQAKLFKLQSLGNIGLNAIATILGVEGNPVTNKLPRLECAQQIFGDEPFILKAIREEQERKEILEKVTPVQVKEAILASEYNTPESWVMMTSKQAKLFKLQSLGNIGLNAIATILNVEGDPVGNRLPRLECAQQIFGDEPFILKAIREKQEK